MARYNVRGVMKSISSNASQALTVFRMPRNMYTPTQNSTAASRMPTKNSKAEGNQPMMPNAVR